MSRGVLIKFLVSFSLLVIIRSGGIKKILRIKPLHYLQSVFIDRCLGKLRKIIIGT